MARCLELKWTEDATDDIESIGEFISRDSEFYAKAVVRKIVEKIENIPENPEIGRIVPEMKNPDIRERFVYSYRLIYQLSEHAISLIAIFPGKQPMDKQLNERIGI